MHKRHITLTALCSVVALTANCQTAKDMTDKEQLTIGLEYFGSGKYGEALNILSRLDKKYKLNPRFKAYIGLCYYYEWDYKNATCYLDSCINDIEIYSPHERSVYYFADAESHFNLGNYTKAIPLYEKQLNVCHDNEKGDVFFHLGYCYMNNAEWQNALDNLSAALLYYERYGYPANKKSRLVQIEKMIKGCERETRKEKEK